MNSVLKHTIPNRNKEELFLIELLPEDNEIKAIIQFHSGTVIKKEFYLNYAKFLTTFGYAVVLFDYRGVGESKPSNLKNCNASISTWGLMDAPAVTDWILQRYPNKPIHLLAHSMGGQILGLMDNWSLFDKVILLASSSGNWHNFKPSLRRKVKLSTKILFPFFLWIFGYVPGRFGLGQDWPKRVAQEWSNNAEHNQLMAQSMQQSLDKTEYENINKEIHAIFFADDPMSTPLTVPNIARSYPSVNVITRLIEPAEYGLKEIGHFGMFKSYNLKTLGKIVIDLLHSDNTAGQ